MDQNTSGGISGSGVSGSFTSSAGMTSGSFDDDEDDDSSSPSSDYEDAVYGSSGAERAIKDPEVSKKQPDSKHVGPVEGADKYLYSSSETKDEYLPEGLLSSKIKLRICPLMEDELCRVRCGFPSMK